MLGIYHEHLTKMKIELYGYIVLQEMSHRVDHYLGYYPFAEKINAYESVVCHGLAASSC